VFEYRVTKYNPRFRDERGAYTRDEWTSVGDIGRVFDGVLLTPEAYQRTEDAYVEAALAFAREARLSLRVTDPSIGNGPSLFGEGMVLGPAEFDRALRAALRETFWCRFESAAGFVHVGYDYYMYIGVQTDCPKAIAFAAANGLFAEPWISPYHPEPEDDEIS
jgi:hypothetical protein